MYFIFDTFDLSIIFIFFNIIFTTSLSLLKLTRTATYLSTSNLSTLLFRVLKLLNTFFNLPVSDLSTSDFKLAKSTFLANFGVLSGSFFKYAFVANN